MDEGRKRRFEIIKIIYGNLTIRNRPNSTYKDIAGILQIKEHEVSNEIKVLGNAGFVGTQSALSERMVYLLPKSVQVMERRPSPRNYDEFLDMSNDPQKPFGKPEKIEGYKESFWERHPFLKIITPIGSVASIIGFVLFLIFQLGIGS